MTSCSRNKKFGIFKGHTRDLFQEQVEHEVYEGDTVELFQKQDEPNSRGACLGLVIELDWSSLLTKLCSTNCPHGVTVGPFPAS